MSDPNPAPGNGADLPGPQAAGTGLGAARQRAVRRRRHRRRRGRGRRRPGRRHPRAEGGAGRGPRLRLRHLEPLVEDVPRRAALPRAAGVRVGPRGAARARAVADHAGAASGQAAAVSVPADQAVVGAAVHRGGHLPLRPARRREIGSGAKAFDSRGRAAVVARAQAQLADRRDPLLRHRRRRRPAHHDGGAHRGALRRGGAVVDARWCRCCARATG